MHFVSVVVLDAKHHTEITAINSSVLLYQVNEIVQDLVVERLDVFYNQNYGLRDALSLQDLLYAIESLLLEDLVLLGFRGPGLLELSLPAGVLRLAEGRLVLSGPCNCPRRRLIYFDIRCCSWILTRV